MTIYQFTNNANTTLATGISATSLTLTVTAGTGSLFPASNFKVTLLDAATQFVNEIVLCTSRTGDVLTIQRAQEGTVADNWAPGDIVTLLITAGELDNFVQTDQLQGSTYFYCVGAGTGNSITATLPSNLTSLPDGFNITVEAVAANTGAATLTLTLGSTTQLAYPIVKYAQSPLSAGDIPAAHYPINLTWSANWNAYVMNNPGTSVAGDIAGGATNELLVQTSAGNTGFITAPTGTNKFLQYNGTAISWGVPPAITDATNLLNGAQYQIPYQTAVNTTTFAPAPSVVGTVLAFTGSGFAWATPPSSGVATSMNTGNYTIAEVGGKLVISYQGTPIVSVDSVGDIIAKANITSVGSP